MTFVPDSLFPMKKHVLLTLALFAALITNIALRAQTQTAINSGDRLAICGDSITEQKFYSAMMETYLLACQPAAARPANVCQFGWGGERITGIFSRLESDVLPFKPTLVTLCYGMNDGRYLPQSKEIEDAFRAKLVQTVQALKQAGVRQVIVGTPGAVDTETFKRLSPEVYNNTLRGLGEIAREVAKAENVGFADVHGPMIEAMKKAKARHGADYPVAGGDGVHPGRNGHLVMMYAFLKALGCDGDIATIRWDAAKANAQASGGHKVVSSTAAELTLESTRYPFCFSGAEGSGGTRDMMDLSPFNDELNRFTLIVTGLKSDRVRLTWGRSNKEFTRARLERGINLAAEFVETPFGRAFHTLLETVTDQQRLETPLIKTIWHDAEKLRAWAPTRFDAFKDEITATRESLWQKSAAPLAPVTHKLVIEQL